jgi:hypothetical protein
MQSFVANKTQRPVSAATLIQFSGGIVGAICVTPLIAVSALAQTGQPWTNPELLLHAMKKGLVTRLTWTGMEKFMKLTVYERVLRQFKNTPSVHPLILSTIAGSIAGAAQAALCTPVEQFTLQRALNRAATLPETLRTTLKHPWRGLPLCMMRDIPFSAMVFPAQTFLREQWGPSSHFMSGIAGACAAGCAAVIVTPFDQIKTRIQMGMKPCAFNARDLLTSAAARGLRSILVFFPVFWFDSVRRHMDKKNA